MPTAKFLLIELRFIVIQFKGGNICVNLKKDLHCKGNLKWLKNNRACKSPKIQAL